MPSRSFFGRSWWWKPQMKQKLTELDTALNDMAANLDKGYDEARALVDSVDKKGT